MNSFSYDGRHSSEFDLVVAGFKVSDPTLNLKRSTQASTMNKYRSKVNVYGINYDSVLTIEFQMMRDVCKYQSQEELKFSRTELRKITSWLTSPTSPRIFHMFSEEPEYDYFGLFTNVEIDDDFILNFTFECTTPYALSQEQTFTIEQEDTINNLSDELEGYVYPVITITPTIYGDHSITIKNVSDDNRAITLNNMKLGEVVTMDCQKLTIKNSYGSLLSFDELDIEGLNYIYWPRLIAGENQIQVSNGAILEFKFRYPVKVGGY